MKLTLSLRQGSGTTEHQLELRFLSHDRLASGKLTYMLDGQAGEADCAPIAPGAYSILIGGRSYEVQVACPTRDAAANPGRRIVTLGARDYVVDVHDPRRHRSSGMTAVTGGPQEVLAPMPGKIVKILVEKSQEVTPGAGLLVIEAMKMQNELRAPRAGRVEEIYVAEGAGVEMGAHLVRLV